jgi:hypothetical protein
MCRRVQVVVHSPPQVPPSLSRVPSEFRKMSDELGGPADVGLKADTRLPSGQRHAGKSPPGRSALARPRCFQSNDRGQALGFVSSVIRGRVLSALGILEAVPGAQLTVSATDCSWRRDGELVEFEVNISERDGRAIAKNVRLT